MNFLVATSVFEKYPDLNIGVISLRGIQNSGEHNEVINMLRSAEAGVRSQLDLENFRDHPHIATLREVHRDFENNPNKNPPSVQALVKLILKGGELPIINPLVDIYNVFSLRHIVCAGAEDTDKCTGDVRLDYADGTEPFRLLGEEEDSPPLPGELVYKDDAGAICRKLNWREGDRTKITEDTNNAIVVVEGFPPFDRDQLEVMLNEMNDLFTKYVGGESSIHILSPDNQSCSLDA